jgi:carbamoyltransferase
MKLGLSLSHDSSAAITQSDGVVVSAIAEERISRVKNHFGIPKASMTMLLSQVSSENIDEIIIGSHELLSFEHAYSMLANLDGNPSNKVGSRNKPYPSFLNSKVNRHLSPHDLIVSKIKEFFDESGLPFPNTITWVNHHDSHLGCALGSTSQKECILVSLDGQGDGESGAISVLNHNPKSEKTSIQSVLRIPALDSLGLLYSAVTARYNFKPMQHEGKITGLAAFGKHSQAYEILAKHVTVENGVPSIDYVKNLKSALTVKSLRRLGFTPRGLLSMDEIVDLAESSTSDYADLAWAIQEVLEESVLEMLGYWSKRTGIKNFALAGGVFANVKVNQRIAESEFSDEVTIFPNMGDGGISLGGIWFELAKRKSLSSEPLYKSMFLAPPNSMEVVNDNQLNFIGMKLEEIYRNAAKAIANGESVAIHQGEMEFGPRALGNRSLLLDPRDKNIVRKVNQRLQRTEFMPFAPMILESEFGNWFSSSSALREPFYYMTMTCEVLEERRLNVPAITHVDGTARPQIVNAESNPFAFNIIEEFMKLTGVPIVVNTSLNIHEEPINYTLNDSIRALKRGAIDVIYTSDGEIRNKSWI